MKDGIEGGGCTCNVSGFELRRSTGLIGADGAGEDEGIGEPLGN
jgi:hypothetical protein